MFQPLKIKTPFGYMGCSIVVSDMQWSSVMIDIHLSTVKISKGGRDTEVDADWVKIKGCSALIG